jgi:hypothetical protein
MRNANVIYLKTRNHAKRVLDRAYWFLSLVVFSNDFQTCYLLDMFLIYMQDMAQTLFAKYHFQLLYI